MSVYSDRRAHGDSYTVIKDLLNKYRDNLQKLENKRRQALKEQEPK